jgi:hypothetical protein
MSGGITLANLTIKELAALQDQISSEQTLVKKYQAMGFISSDPKLQQQYNDYAQKHQQHYDALMTFLK